MVLETIFPMRLLPPGEKAPAFHLIADDGECVNLHDRLAQAEKGVILLFFATDNLPRDRKYLADWAAASGGLRVQGYEILALSAVNWETLHHLRRELALPFSLLFDVGVKIAKQYGAILLPRFITGRAVFVVGKDGRIAQATDRLKPDAIRL